MFIPALIVGGLLLFAVGATTKRRTGRPASVRAPTEQEAVAIGFCAEHGGMAVPMETDTGDVFFVCQFPDGRVAEVVEFMEGVEPVCPLNMLVDPETGACIPSTEGPSVDDILGDPEFQICTSTLVDAWREPEPGSYNLDAAVAANIRVIFETLLEDEPLTPDDLFLVGMTHVSPECDFGAYDALFGYMVEAGAIPPDVQAAVTDIVTSVASIVNEFVAVDAGFAGADDSYEVVVPCGTNKDGTLIYCPMTIHAPEESSEASTRPMRLAKMRRRHRRGRRHSPGAFAGGSCAEACANSEYKAWCLKRCATLQKLPPPRPSARPSRFAGAKLFKSCKTASGLIDPFCRQRGTELRDPFQKALPGRSFAGGCRGKRKGHCGVRRRVA